MAIVEIKGGKYRYEYNSATGDMEYFGPVGDSPSLSESQFLDALKKNLDQFQYKTSPGSGGDQPKLPSTTIIDGRLVEQIENVTPKRNWPYMDLWKVKFKVNMWQDDNGRLWKDRKNVHYFFKDDGKWIPLSDEEVKELKTRWR
jgi:hypothetical protein